MSDIIEAAARALLKWDGGPIDPTEWYYEAAHAVLAAVTPLIRAAALEEAAMVADEHFSPDDIECFAEKIAIAIRALKEQP